jgi:hypothetical protein
MAKSKLLSIAWIMILIIGLALIIAGVIYASQGTLMPYHEEFVGMTPSEIRNFNPELMVFVGGLIAQVGFLFISLGIVNIGLCLTGFRKGERSSWITLLVIDAVAFIPLTYASYLVGGFDMPFPIMLTVLILWVIAMCLSAKEALTSQ